VIYGEAKTRQMARSVLPSTMQHGGGRWQASKHMIHGAERARVRRELQRATAYVDLDDYDGDLSETRTFRSKIKSYVGNRRDADKVNPLQKWATAICVRDEIPQENRESYFRSILPKSLIGRHALGHLEYIFKAEDLTSLNESFRRRYRSKDYTWDKEQTKAQLVSLLQMGLGGALKLTHTPNYKVIGYNKVRMYEGGLSYYRNGTTIKPRRAEYYIYQPIKELDDIVQPKLTDVASIDEFLNQVEAASKPQAHGVGYWNQAEDRWCYQTNKLYHPEWLSSLKSFFSGQNVSYSRAPDVNTLLYIVLHRANRYKDLLITNKFTIHQEYWWYRGKKLKSHVRTGIKLENGQFISFSNLNVRDCTW
jgi:hypothetical protein